LKKLLTSLLLGLLVMASPAMALDFDFNGTFTHDNDIALSSLTVGAASNVTIFTSSWQSGGFDPVLTLWNSSGNFIIEQDDSSGAGSAISNAVTYNYGQWDSYFTYNLTAGTYTVSIAQYNNFAAGTNLSSGFQEDGNPNFTFDYGWGTQPYFNGIQNDNDARTGNWALHVIHVNPAPTPSVPDTFPTISLLGVAMLALLGLKRRFS
jgi:hypothetical protein